MLTSSFVSCSALTYRGSQVPGSSNLGFSQALALFLVLCSHLLLLTPVPSSSSKAIFLLHLSPVIFSRAVWSWAWTFPFSLASFFPSSFPYYNISQALTQSGLCAYLNICLCLWANLSGLLRTGDCISALNWVGWPTRDKASSIAFFPPLFFFLTDRPCLLKMLWRVQSCPHVLLMFIYMHVDFANLIVLMLILAEARE